jgi:hypothetical protein
MANQQLCDANECVFEFLPGDTLELVAQPTKGSSFGGWPTPCDDRLDCTLVVDDDMQWTLGFDASGAILDHQSSGHTTYSRYPVLRHKGDYFSIVDVNDSDLSQDAGIRVRRSSSNGDVVWEKNIVVPDSSTAVYSSDSYSRRLGAFAIGTGGELYLSYSTNFYWFVNAQKSISYHQIFKIDSDNGSIEWNQRAKAKDKNDKTTSIILNARVDDSGNLLMVGSFRGQRFDVNGSDISVPVDAELEPNSICFTLNKKGGLLGLWSTPERFFSSFDAGTMSFVSPGSIVMTRFSGPSLTLEKRTLSGELLFRLENVGGNITANDEHLYLVSQSTEGMGQSLSISKRRLSDGALLWEKDVLRAPGLIKPFISVHPNASIYIAGGFYDGSAEIDGEIFAQYGGMDIFVTGLSPMGEKQFAFAISGTGDERVQNMSFDGENNVLLDVRLDDKIVDGPDEYSIERMNAVVKSQTTSQETHLQTLTISH